jgi:hypothetical protein
VKGQRRSPEADWALEGYLRLDRDRLGERTAEAFPAIYSTTISIVQGVILGYLAVQHLRICHRLAAWIPRE